MISCLILESRSRTQIAKLTSIERDAVYVGYCLLSGFRRSVGLTAYLRNVKLAPAFERQLNHGFNRRVPSLEPQITPSPRINTPHDLWRPHNSPSGAVTRGRETNALKCGYFRCSPEKSFHALWVYPSPDHCSGLNLSY